MFISIIKNSLKIIITLYLFLFTLDPAEFMPRYIFFFLTNVNLQLKQLGNLDGLRRTSSRGSYKRETRKDLCGYNQRIR